MYQSVDDIEEGSSAQNDTEVSRLKLGAGILLGVGLLAAVTVFSSNDNQPVETGDTETSEQYEIYSKALSEPDPKLRRARLLDFVQNFPDHDRVEAANAQLSIIQQADDKAWLSLQEVMFDPAQSAPAKLAAVDLYEEMWGSVLLGSRETEITELRNSLDPDAEKQPEEPEEPAEDFTPKPDQFDESIDGTQLAGGIVVVERTYIPPPPIVKPIEVLPTRNIEKPRIRKDRTPRYPRKALRKGVEAEVVLMLSIDDKGEVKMTEVVSARAPRYRKDFIKAAERAALRTKYYPKKVDGKAIATGGVLKRYRFQIGG